jgi:hypothetical protein
MNNAVAASVESRATGILIELFMRFSGFEMVVQEFVTQRALCSGGKSALASIPCPARGNAQKTIESLHRGQGAADDQLDLRPCEPAEQNGRKSAGR